jgi:uncharacterized protein
MSRAGDDLRERHRRFPSVTEAFFLVIALYVAEYVAAAGLRDLNALTGMDARDISGAVIVIGNGILFSVLLYYKRMSYASLFHPSSNSVGATLGAVGLPVLLVVPAAVLAMLSATTLLERLFPLSPWERMMFERMMSSELAAFVAVCVLAPLLEEMLFRGIILRSFLQQYPRGQAFLYSSLLFGFAHLNIYQFVVGFCGGLCLAWLYERTRSLWPCVLAHAAYNGVITMLWWSAARPGDLALPDTPLVWLLAVALAAPAVLVLRRLLAPRAAQPVPLSEK